MFGEDRRKGRRHVLGDENGREIDHCAEAADHRVERLRSAGRRADHQRPRQRRARTAAAEFPAGCPAGGPERCWDWGPRPRAIGREPGRFAGGRSGPQPPPGAECADLVDQIAAEGQRAGEIAIGLRLGQVVRRAERERAQADFGIAAGQRRHHQHHEIAAHLEQTRQRRDAVDLRHVDVENDDIRGGALELLDRLATVVQRRHDVQIRLGIDPARHHAARHHGVVDHHDADRIGGTRAKPKQGR